MINLLNNSIDDVTNESFEIAKRYQRIISQPFLFKDRTLTVGSSIGIRVIDDMGTNQNDLIKEADFAMYQVKHKAKDFIAIYDKATMTRGKTPALTH